MERRNLLEPDNVSADSAKEIFKDDQLHTLL